ncbi:AtpZ/AtpI family protein [Bartonella sp. B41]
MAKGSELVVPRKETKGKKQKNFFHPEDLECRSKDLGLALMRKQAFKKKEFKNKKKELQGGMARAVKLSSDFLASIIVGVVLGLGFDKLAGSLPWGLVFFLFLGFAAGVLSILRSVGYIPSSKLRQSGALRRGKKVGKRSNK